MSEESCEELCKYKPGREIDYYASGLAGILRVVVGPGRESTHAYVKEVRRALETLVFSIWDKEEYIPIVAEANVPDSIRSSKAKTCFKDLLEALLRRFKETTNDLPIGSRIRLMNMTVAAIAEMARWDKIPPAGEKIKSCVFSQSPQSSSSSSESEVEA